MTRIDVAGVITEPETHALWEAYAAVFDDQPDEATWREKVWDRHAARGGFRVARATCDDVLVGFAYGYTGADGQWWTDTVRKRLPGEVADRWLGGHFEVVSLGVIRSARGSGLGRALLAALLEGIPHERLLLMTTADARDPARRLYASDGWDVLGPGVSEAAVVMGRQALPGHPTSPVEEP